MKVVVIDYGMGNVLSVQRAIAHCGYQSLLTDNYDNIVTADFLILPGVGAIGPAMQELSMRHIDHAIRDFLLRERPLLGICLGMQALADSSDEFGSHSCLGIIPGQVKKMAYSPICVSDNVNVNNRTEIERPASAHTRRTKIPNIGWYAIEALRPNTWCRSCLRNIPPRAETYFVHSYEFSPKNQQDILAYYTIDELQITAAVQKDNITGTQFHPEKSGPIGLSILGNFFDQRP